MTHRLRAMVEKLKSCFKINERLIVLTDHEFIAAGDCLVAKCPTWSWESGDLSKRKSCLPTDKQFLILRNVPCEEDYVFVVGGDEEDDRRLIHWDPSESKNEDNLLSTEEWPEPYMETPIQTINSYFSFDDKEEIPHMGKPISSPATQESTHRLVHDPEDRIYDISITYDEDRQTPHFWLTGYHKDGRLLQPELILDDVRQNCTGTTVTIEDHPYLPGKHASVQPRVHGASVKEVVDNWISRGIVAQVDKCLFLFLEFVSSVFPTIKHGCNMNFDPESCSN